MTAAAFINADILRRLADDTRPVPAGDAFAAEFGRDPSNFRKTLKLLEGDGLVVRPAGQPAAITDLGRQTLRGIDVAEGREPAPGSAAPDRWPVAAIRPNPTNRQITEQSAIDMAGEILGFGDIIQPLTLTPADANGVRMILAGERRWRGASILTGALGDMIQRQVLGDEPVPAALLAGVPFVEREADEATAILITIVENGAREDLSPLEDAEQLLKLAEATGWSGAEIARRTGRLSETKKNGAKDVQDKLKIAREATPEAISEYRRTGSWDDLRNSVRDRREPEADPDQLPMFEEGEGEAEPLSPFAELALVEVLWAMRFIPFAPDGNEQAVLTDGYLYRSGGLSQLTAQGYLDYLAWDLKGGRACVVRPNAKAEKWAQHRFTNGCPNLSEVIEWREHVGLEPGSRMGADADDDGFCTASLNAAAKRKQLLAASALTGPHVVNGVDYLNATRAQEARYAQGIDKRPQPNSGGARPEEPASPSREPSPRARVALLELAYKIEARPELLGPTAELSPSWGEDIFGNYRTFGAKIGSYWIDPAFAELDKLGYVQAKHRPGLTPLAQITDQGVAWFAVSLISIPPRWPEIYEARTAIGLSHPIADSSAFATEWLEYEAKPAAEPEADPSPQLAGDDWGRDAEQIVSDKNLLADALTLYHADDEEPDEAAARDLMQRLGICAPFDEDGDAGLYAQIGGKTASIAIIDPERAMSHERSRATALLITWACRVVFGDDTYSPVAVDTVSAPDNPAVPIRKSITADFLICLEDGRKFKSLKRHLRTRYNLSPEEYRERWGLASDYPMQAPNYTRAREELAQRMGLGMAGSDQ